MTQKILKLFPQPCDEIPVYGVYLEHAIHQQHTTGKPIVYANFVASLDGRISLGDSAKDEDRVPEALTSHTDWRLFQELQAQADCFITGAGYLRALAKGEFPDILQVGLKSESADLATWRAMNGLPRQPAIVVPSVSLDIPLPASLKTHNQQIVIATTQGADVNRARELESAGAKVVVCGTEGMVDGAALLNLLTELGFKSIYAVAGPKMLNTLLRARVLDRLYLTITHQIIGGRIFDTILEGAELGDAGYLRLSSLLYDPTSPASRGQWFARFDCMQK